MYKKQEDKINRLFLELLAIDRDVDGQEWKTIWWNLSTVAYEYYADIYGKRVEYDPGHAYVKFKFAEELLNILASSLKRYKYDQDVPVIHYLNKIVSQRINAAESKERLEESSGMRIPDGMSKQIRHLLRYAEETGRDINDLSFQHEVARKFGWTNDQIKAVLRAHSFQHTLDIYHTVNYHSKIDEENIAFDQIKDNFSENNVIQFIELDDFEQKITDLLGTLEEIYQNRRETACPLTAALLTLHVLKDVSRHNDLFVQVCDKLSSCSFCDDRILNSFKNGEKLPTQKAIAAEHNCDATHVSRTLGIIKKELKKRQVFS